MYTITKEFTFCASHQLKGLPENHPCSKLHGHNYVVKVELQSKTLNDIGFVVDYRQLTPIKEWLDKTVDHKHLNDLFVSMNPTAENMARYFFTIFRMLLKEQGSDPNMLYAVEVSETPKTNARYVFD